MMTISSSAFSDGEPIPFRFAKAGENVSPELSWSGVPEGTKELAIVCEDPDAPAGTFVHWILFGLEPQSAFLPEALPRSAEIQHPIIAKQGMNSAGKIGYIGPYPPAGDDSHRYRFKLFALKHKLGVNAKVSEEEFYSALEDNILEMAEVTGKFRSLQNADEAPNYRFANIRAPLRTLAARGAGVAARVSTATIGVIPAKPLLALGLAAVAGGVVAYVRASRTNS